MRHLIAIAAFLLIGVTGLDAATFTYTVGEWSSCSSSCGVGVKIRSVTCVNGNGDIVSNLDCQNAGHERPASHQACNFNVLCPPEVQYIHDGPCSHSCGGGTRVPRTVCRRKNNQGGFNILPHSACVNVTQPELETVRSPCNTDIACPPIYDFGPWGHCSMTCGQGTQSRRVRCYQRRSGRVLRVALRSCHAALGYEPHVQACSLGECRDNYRWRSTEWGLCNVQCEQGRVVKCFSAKDAAFVDPVECAHEEKPAEIRRCIHMGTLKWNVTAWSRCSMESGECARHRQVRCLDTRTGEESASCALCLKPNEYRQCHPRHCPATAGAGGCEDQSNCRVLAKADDSFSRMCCQSTGLEFSCCNTCQQLGY